jgi:hypothetical protein
MPRRKEVDAWFGRYDNPMKPVVMRMREMVLAADARVEECIQWQAPTFVFAGTIASFFPKAKPHASLMFHTGAKIPGRHPRLEGSGDTARVLKIGSLAEAAAAAGEIAAIIRAWCDWRDGGERGQRPKGSPTPRGATRSRPKPSGGSGRRGW